MVYQLRIYEILTRDKAVLHAVRINRRCLGQVQGRRRMEEDQEEPRAVHGDLVGAIEGRTRIPTHYSPALPLQTAAHREGGTP